MSEEDKEEKNIKMVDTQPMRARTGACVGGRVGLSFGNI